MANFAGTCTSDNKGLLLLLLLLNPATAKYLNVIHCQNKYCSTFSS